MEENDESKTMKLVKQLDDATKKLEEATLRNQESLAKLKLGGNGEAGTPPAKKETNSEYAKRIMSGEQ